MATQFERYIFSNDKTLPIFNDNINEDGTIDDTIVETYFCPINNIYHEPSGDYVRINADNGAADVEIRLEVTDLKKILELIATKAI